ncbi:MAG: tryptophanase [Eubacteriales bacterium]|nr:tryptophanase [Eubacteriales bacterium]
MANYVKEPFRIKMVEPLMATTREERERYLKEAHYNLFALRSEWVSIDLLTDSGTGAMSSAQWAAMMQGDESYAGAAGYYKLEEAVQDIFNYQYMQPVHQGRAAEKVLFPIFLKPGMVSLSNMHFDTTRGHVTLAGAEAVDLVCEEARMTGTYAPFKGNMDLERLKDYLAKAAAKVGVIIMTLTNNSAGGQPVSLANLKAVSEIAKEYKIPLVIDAARFAENAYFIKQREPEYKDASIKKIVRACFQLADCFTMSAKKDAIVNMGGLIGIREDRELFEKVKINTVPMEGFITYGGLAGRDLEALAIGLYEGIDPNFLHYRIAQVEYLGEGLKEIGIPIQYPCGGHAIFVDARELLPHIPYYEFPAQALALELYLESGIRSCDVGSYMLDLDPETGEQLEAEMEFTRLCLPRRVYTQAHLDEIIRAFAKIKEKAEQIKGYKIIEQAPVLRHFTAKLEPIK